MKEPIVSGVEGELRERLKGRLLERRARLAEGVARYEGTEAGALVEEVDHALARLAGGRYGICERCHDSMSPERLLGDPLARVCLECLSEPEARALERDLEAAGAIQRALLPPLRLRLAGWDIGRRWRPAGTVSGDHVDVLDPGPGGNPVHVAVGDVSGKGIAASLLMSHLHAALRALVTFEQPLASVVEQANRLFAASAAPSSYVTLALARLHADGQVELVNAGHPPVLVLRRDGTEAIDASGLPLGVEPRSRYQVRRLRLSPGELLFLYTDGLSEAADAGDRQFGIERVEASLRELFPLPDDDLLDGVLDRADAFRNGAPARDDLTLMAIRRAA